MFLFSFYTRGMSFVDMAYLKKNDLKNGILTYRPVSYTHLSPDIVALQELDSVTVRNKGIHALGELEKPVSYTHLDVYKRQVTSPAKRHHI